MLEVEEVDPRERMSRNLIVRERCSQIHPVPNHFPSLGELVNIITTSAVRFEHTYISSVLINIPR